MPYDAFSHVDSWIFDLDNTLYPREVNLFGQIEVHMADFVMSKLGLSEEEAHKLRRTYWKEHGTTLAGLITNHNIDPHEFLQKVHDIDLSGVPTSPTLRQQICDLPGRKVIFTNGSKEHARRVSAARGLDGIFDAIYGIEDAEFVPKPDKEAFSKIIELDKLDPTKSAMFEDDPRNLDVPYQLGMNTVLVGATDKATHIQYETEDLSTFLELVLRP